MQWLLDFVNSFAHILFSVLIFIFHAIVIVLGTFIGLIIVGFFTVVYSVVSALDLGSWAVGAASNWGLLDPNIAYLINQTGFPTGLSMLGSAYLIRLILNLIPSEFTRL